MSAAAGVNPDRILRDLADIWLVVAKPESEEGSGVLRACSMTLVILVNAEDDPQKLNEMLAQLMREHPARAIVVRVAEGTDQLEARVYAQCWRPDGHSQQICCEQVELIVSLNRLGDIPSIVAPLLAPDLPRVVWFRSPRLSEAADVSGLFTLGDKFIVDSSLDGAPSFADLRTLASAGYVLGDLAWTRITALRQLLAQLLAERQPAGLSRIQIDYAGADASPEARYLQAWLRSSLPAAEVDLQRAGNTGDGSIRCVRIDPDVHVDVSGDCAEFEAGSTRQRANLPPVTELNLLNEELNIVRHDPVFERTLQRMTIWTPSPWHQKS